MISMICLSSHSSLRKFGDGQVLSGAQQERQAQAEERRQQQEGDLVQGLGADRELEEAQHATRPVRPMFYLLLVCRADPTFVFVLQVTFAR